MSSRGPKRSRARAPSRRSVRPVRRRPRLTWPRPRRLQFRGAPSILPLLSPNPLSPAAKRTNPRRSSSFRPRRSSRSPGRPACRRSRTCRRSRRTSCAPCARGKTPSRLRRRAAGPSSRSWPHSALRATRRSPPPRRSPRRPRRQSRRFKGPMRWLRLIPAVPSSGHRRCAPSARSTPTADPSIALRSRRTTTSTSRRFYGGSRTDSAGCEASASRLGPPRKRHYSHGSGLIKFINP